VTSTQRADTPNPVAGVQLHVVVESKPGAALLVERVDLSAADIRALTTSAQILSSGAPPKGLVQPSRASLNSKLQHSTDRRESERCRAGAVGATRGRANGAHRDVDEETGCIWPCSLAERVGFEPTDGCPSLVFKTSAIDRSAISPVGRRIRVPCAGKLYRPLRGITPDTTDRCDRRYA
jgi:hypothetical protein